MGGALKVSKKSSERIWNPAGHYGRQAIFGTKTKQKAKKGGGGGGGGGDPMLEYMSQMQAEQAAQAEATRKAQEEALLESQRQSALASARQGEMGAQQFLSQAGGMQQARDAAALAGQQQAFSGAGQSAMGGGYDINKAQQEATANLGGYGQTPVTGQKLPFYGFETQNTGAGATSRGANVFNLPQTSGLKFGGA